MDRIPIPQPSQIFATALGQWRPGQKMAPLRAREGPSAPPEPVVAAVPRPPVALTSASASAHKEHARRVRGLQRRQLPTGTHPSSPPPSHAPSPSLKRKLMQMAQHHFQSDAPAAHGLGQRIQEVFRSNPQTTPPVIMQEWNQEASTLLTVLAARFLGMEPRSLVNSPGLRALVVQQLGWLHPAPDWMKLAGLLLTKKCNQMLLPMDPNVMSMLSDGTLPPNEMSGMVLDHLNTPLPVEDDTVTPNHIDAPPPQEAEEEVIHDAETLGIVQYSQTEEEQAHQEATNIDDSDLVVQPSEKEAVENLNPPELDAVVEPPTKRARRTKRAQISSPVEDPSQLSQIHTEPHDEISFTPPPKPKKTKTGKTIRVKPQLSVDPFADSSPPRGSLFEDPTVAVPPSTPTTA
jgi:hypothetical protein